MTYEETLKAQLADCEKKLTDLAYDERPEAHERRETLVEEVKLLEALLEGQKASDSA